MHADWPPVISSLIGLSSLLSLQAGVEVPGLQGKSGTGLVKGHHTSRFIYTQPLLAARDVMPERSIWKVALDICSQRGEERTYGRGQGRAKQGKI